MNYAPKLFKIINFEGKYVVRLEWLDRFVCFIPSSPVLTCRYMYV